MHANICRAIHVTMRAMRAKCSGGLLTLALSMALFAQAPSTFQVQIQVTDQTGAAIPDAMIQIDDETAVQTTPIKTNRDGFTSMNMHEGKYAFVISSQGFKTWKSTLTVQAGSPNLVHVVLRISDVSDPVLVDPLSYPKLPVQYESPSPIPYLALETLRVPATHAKSYGRNHDRATFPVK